MSNISEELAKEISRVSTILGYYKEIGPAGLIGSALIQSDLNAAIKAQGSGDAIEIARSLTTLREIKE